MTQAIYQSSPPLKLIIFDLDGVLINSLTVMRMAFEAALFDHFGSSLSPDWATALFSEYRKHLGKGFKQIMTELKLPHELHEPFKFHSRYLARYVRPYNGVQAMLNDLKQMNLKLTIATGKDSDRAVELLDQLALSHFFDVISGSDQVHSPKPSPDMAIKHMESLNCAPSESLIIGDSPTDIACGRAASITCLAALWGYSSKQELTACRPDQCFDRPEQIIEWVKSRV